ncbi:MAG: hypothetical protein HY303_21975 [Candidatus Wallbacteria bacterium]|nr:hypothetical protein [Candidatus Wallbacteria bacterium]
MRVAIPAQVSLLATLEDADLAANAGQQFRVRWSQLAGPPVDLEPPLDGPGPLRRSRARFTPTTAFLHEFECRATELDSVGHPTGIEVARRISVLVDSPSNACPSAVAGISTVAQKSRAPAAAPVTQLQAQMGATIRLSGAGSSDPGPARGALRYTWVQVSGPTVTLSNPYAAVTTFVAPDPGAVDRRIAFRLFVDDGSARGAPAPVELELLAVGSQVVPVTAFPGINLVAVAVAPSQPGFGARELLDLLRARFLARLDTTGGRSRFVPYSPSLAAIGFGVTGSEGYLAVLDTASPPASVGGTPWTTAELQRTLGPGLCLIALPRGVPAGYTLADLATLTTSRFVVYGETAGGRSRLRVYLPGVTPAAPFAESGKGYLLSVPQSVAVSLPGR